MPIDPFAHLNLEQIQVAEKKYRRAHPILWRVAEFVRDVGFLPAQAKPVGRNSMDSRRRIGWTFDASDLGNILPYGDHAQKLPQGVSDRSRCPDNVPATSVSSNHRTLVLSSDLAAL